MDKGSDLDSEQIIAWAVNYASFEDLEIVAKAVYGIYAQTRKNDHPEVHKANKQAKRKFYKKKSKKW